MLRAYKFRLWTNANQERELGVMLETHRRLYNSALAQRKESWEERQESVSVYDQKKILTAARKEDEWLARLNASSAQMTLFRLDQSFQNFFRRVKAGEQPGYPRFKARNRFDSFEYGSHGDGARLKAPEHPRDGREPQAGPGDQRCRLGPIHRHAQIQGCKGRG
jgi:putative transposase